LIEKESRTIQLYGKNGKMIYSIDVQENKETLDIQVDAGNGKVLNNQPGSSVDIGEDLIEEYGEEIIPNGYINFIHRS
jgi:hypothetical protein